MRSRIYQLKSYKEVDFADRKQTFVCDEAQISKELQRLQNRYIQWVSGEKAGPGDVAVCRLESANPRFNKKKLQLVAGGGMMPKALEQAVMEMTVGQTGDLQVGEDAVTVTVLAVQNKIVPALSDSMVASAGIEGIDTVAAYRAYLIQGQKAKAAEMAAYPVVNDVLDTVEQASEFILDQKDWAYMADMELHRYRVLCRQEGLDIETMTAEDFQPRIPVVKSYDGVVALVRLNAWRTLRRYLIGRFYAEQEGYTVTREAYEAYLQEYAKSWNVSLDDARESNTYENYEVTQYAFYFVDKVKNYVQENIYKEEA